MQTHLKKRVDMIVEEAILHRITDILDRLEVSGYTVFPAVAGRGREGHWQSQGQVSIMETRVMVMCVTDPARAETLLEQLYKLVARQIGIITVSDVQVIRPEHFS